MPLLTFPWPQILSAGGSTYPGAKLFFYETGTSTLATTYTDAALTTPHTNPVVADATGVFPPIYLANKRYKSVLKTAGDVTLFTADPVMGGGDNTVATIAAMTAIDTPTNGATVQVADVNRGGLFVFDTSATSAADNGVTFKADDATSGSWVRQYSGPLNVLWFGADNTGTSATHTEINAAIAAAFAEGDPFPAVYIPSGLYLISAPIDRSGNGNYVDLFGDGRRNTVIRATGTAFNSMLLLAESGEVANHTTIRDMTLQCADIAEYGVEASYMRYWTLQNVEISDATTAGIVCGNWLTRIINCRFGSCPIGVFVDGKASASSAQNNFVVELCCFNQCPIGIKVAEFSNDITITKNSFDACDDVGVWVARGGRNVDITGNYFERCGSDGAIDGSVSVPLTVSTTDDIGAAIIISHNYGSLSDSTWEGAIRDNFFANCNSERLIALYNVASGVIENNPAHDSYSTDALVDLRAEGVSQARGRRLVVRGAYPTGVVAQLVSLNGTDVENNHCNIVADNQAIAGGNFPKFFLNNPTRSDWTGATTINEAYYGGYKEFEFDAVADGATTDRVFSVDFTTLTDHPLLGRYVRVHYANKGSASSTGVRCRISVSGSTILDIQRSASTYTEAGRGMTVYVPTTATSFEVRLDAITTANAKMIGFCVCDAAYDIPQVPIAV